ncbi:MAG: hypothetical protein ACI9DC_003203 [Gammaproteobacteria bacterium]|jgi:hypothetical protein
MRTEEQVLFPEAQELVRELQQRLRVYRLRFSHVEHAVAMLCQHPYSGTAASPRGHILGGLLRSVACAARSMGLFLKGSKQK